MKKIIQQTIMAAILVFSLYGLTGCFSTSSTSDRDQYSRPDWAPAYERGVRYYYIPDIETYYDLSSRSFIYLDRGQWISSYDLPPMYRSYDLYNGYEIALDRNVYEPWRYHQNYVSSYPRYYYREMYPSERYGNVRGYNENAKKPVYSATPSKGRRSSSTGNRNPEPIVNQRSGNQPQSSQTTTRVGQPVKVTPEMRQPDQGTAAQRRRQSSSSSQTTTQNKTETETNTGTGTGTGMDKPQQQRTSTEAPAVKSTSERRQTPESQSGTTERKENPRRRR